jgi:hypothetical protein
VARAQGAGGAGRDRADAYEAYNDEAGIKPLIGTALGGFTGGDPTKVHHLERDEEFLIELPRAVQVPRLLKSHGVTYARHQGSD